MLRLEILGEDKTHAVCAHRLVRLVLRDTASHAGQSWIIDALDTLEFRGELEIEREDGSALSWTSRSAANRRAAEFRERVTIAGRPVKLRGFIDGQPLGPGANYWRRVLMTTLSSDEQLDGIIAAEDTDGDPSKADGLRQAVSLLERADTVVCLMLPHPEVEAWLVAGFEPDGADEVGWFQAQRDKRGFDPTQNPHRLRAQEAKKVLNALLSGHEVDSALAADELEHVCERCLDGLPRLVERGASCGLTNFVGEIREALYPKLDPASHQ